MATIVVDTFTEHRHTNCVQLTSEHLFMAHTQCISHPNVEDRITNLEDGFSTNSSVVWNIREHSEYFVCVLNSEIVGDFFPSERLKMTNSWGQARVLSI